MVDGNCRLDPAILPWHPDTHGGGRAAFPLQDFSGHGLGGDPFPCEVGPRRPSLALALALHAKQHAALEAAWQAMKPQPSYRPFQPLP